ncbi:MAG: serine hydrolase [Candidatus Pacebacteria bacterium]|nr:serine hydrolase [Candidatus Paceibacterota bacterium]
MGSSNKNSQKFIFLFAAIVVAIVARVWYAGLSATPAGSTDASAAQEGTNPPHIVLMPPAGSVASSSRTALASTDPAGSGNGASTTAKAAYYGEEDTAHSAFTRTARTAVPSFSSEALLVSDPVNAVDIAVAHTDTRWPTASLTKLMTATVAIDHLSMDTRITVTPQMFAVDPDEKTLVVNGTYTVGDLLHVMLMPSSNVAAEALADYYGHTQFMAAMNDRAAQWGMADTYFDDPSGLSAANESTAHDLASLASHVYSDYPAVLSYTDTPETKITELQSRTKVDVKSINTFAGDADFIGGKTGYIPQAGDNLLSLFRVNGKPVLIIVLGAADTAQRFGDTTMLLNWFTMNYH